MVKEEMEKEKESISNLEDELLKTKERADEAIDQKQNTINDLEKERSMLLELMKQKLI